MRGNFPFRAHLNQAVPPRRWQTAICVSAIAVLGLGLRLAHLGAKSLWMDEAISFELARMDWHSFFAVVGGREINMALYYGVLHFWLFLGQSEFAIRALSVGFGVLTIPAIYWLGSLLFDEWSGIAGALILASDPTHIAYSQEARSYSLTILLAVVASAIFVKAIRNSYAAIWAGYVVVNLCGMYSHFFFAWVVIVHWLAACMMRKPWEWWRSLLLSSGFVILLSAPLAYVAYVSRAQQLSWVPATTLTDLPRFLEFANGGGELFGLFCVMLAVSALLSSAPSEGKTFGAIWWLVPVGVSFAASMVRPLVVTRYLLVSMPPLVVLAGRGLAQSRRIVVRWAAVTALVFVSAQGVHKHYRSIQDPNQNNDWRSAAAYVDHTLRDGDAVLFYYGPERFAFDFYRKQNPAVVNYEVFPAASSADILTRKVQEPDEEFLKQLRVRYHRIYLLSEYAPNALSRQVTAALSPSCAPTIGSRYFGFVRVDEFDDSLCR